MTATLYTRPQLVALLIGWGYSSQHVPEGKQSVQVQLPENCRDTGHTHAEIERQGKLYALTFTGRAER